MTEFEQTGATFLTAFALGAVPLALLVLAVYVVWKLIVWLRNKV